MADHIRRNHTRVVLETQHVQWLRLREAVITDDAAVLGLTTRNYANRNAGTGNVVQVPYGLNAILITFIGKPSDQSAAFTWRLYGFRQKNGMAEMIAYGTGNIGDLAVTVHPISNSADATIYYADYLTITAQYWPKPVVVKDIGGASGEVAKIVFDACGITELLCELTACDNETADETDSLEAIYTGY